MAYEQYRPQSFKILPTVVKNLLIINLLMFAATYVLENNEQFNMTAYFSLHYFSSTYFQPYQFITYMFMHGGIDHIFFNMFALWMFGSALENVWGPKRFLIFYMITGVGAGLLYLCYQGFQFSQVHAAIQDLIADPSPDRYLNIVHSHLSEFSSFKGFDKYINDFAGEWSQHLNEPAYLNQAVKDLNQFLLNKMDTPMLGASGAIFGILVAFGMLFPNTELFIMFVPIPIKAKYAVILYAVVELFLGVAQFQGDNVAHFAHLGGAIFGFILVKYWQKRSKRFY